MSKILNPENGVRGLLCPRSLQTPTCGSTKHHSDDDDFSVTSHSVYAWANNPAVQRLRARCSMYVDGCNCVRATWTWTKNLASHLSSLMQAGQIELKKVFWMGENTKRRKKKRFQQNFWQFPPTHTFLSHHCSLQSLGSRTVPLLFYFQHPLAVHEEGSLPIFCSLRLQMLFFLFSFFFSKLHGRCQEKLIDANSPLCQIWIILWLTDLSQG